MSREEIPPWLREHLARYDQLQQNLQTILLQKQQVEVELAEIDRAVSELKKIASDDTVYKSAGSLFIKVRRDDVLKELEEQRELDNTRATILTKQESRARESVKELQLKIDDLLKGRPPQPPEA